MTGLGLITPVGQNAPDTWQSLVAGRSGIGPITSFDASAFPCPIAGEVAGFDPARFMEQKTIRRIDRSVQFAIAACQEAVADAGLVVRPERAGRVGVLLGTGIGGAHQMIEQQRILEEKGPRRVSPFLISHFLPDTASGLVAIALGARGPNFAVTAACATGGATVGEAAETIARGEADVMIAGGFEAPLRPVYYAGFFAMKALAVHPDPTRAVRPFDAKRNGFILGEGAGALVLESREHALARGAPIYARWMGAATSNDAGDMVAVAADGQGIGEADAARAGAGRPPARADLLHQRPRHRHPPQRPRREPRHPPRLRRARPQADGLEHQVDARSHDGGLGSGRGGGGGPELPPPAGGADDQLRAPRPRLRPRLRAEPGPGGPGRICDEHLGWAGRPQLRPDLWTLGGRVMGVPRVVVTGTGMVTPVGIGADVTWQALLRGENGIGPVTLCEVGDISSQVAGEVTGFEVEQWLSRKDARRMDRFVQLAIAASDEAIESSGLDIAADPAAVGCMIGSGIGGIQTLEDQFRIFFERGPARVSPFLVPMFISDMAAGQVSIRSGARGPNVNTVSACASGADALGTAFETLRRGDAQAMIAGGSDAGVTRMSLTAFAAARALSTGRNDDPEHASRAL